MLQKLKEILGFGPAVDYRELMKLGAQIIDVRSGAEYKSGHIKGSVNIPLQVISSQLGKIKKDKPVITCCASGMRSASAKSVLLANGFLDVHNGGGWLTLQSKL
jgi:rhodanese-related sulfurtransferase